MTDKFDRDTKYITDWIKGGEGDDEDGALERSIACLHVGMTERTSRRKVGALESFKYVAAGVCLKEVEKLGSSADVLAGTALALRDRDLNQAMGMLVDLPAGAATKKEKEIKSMVESGQKELVKDAVFIDSQFPRLVQA